MGLTPLRLVIVAVVALIVLGPDKLPQVARQAGSLWHSLRTLQQRVEEELREVAPDLPKSADVVRFVRSPVALLNELADKAKAESDGAGATDAGEDAAPAVFTLPEDDPPPVSDPDRPPLAWGDPSLN